MYANLLYLVYILVYCCLQIFLKVTLMEIYKYNYYLLLLLALTVFVALIIFTQQYIKMSKLSFFISTLAFGTSQISQAFQTRALKYYEK